MSVVSQFMHNSKEPHLKIVNQILQYSKGSPGRRILFKKREELSLEVHLNANYAGVIINRLSTFVYCTFSGENL